MTSQTLDWFYESKRPSFQNWNSKTWFSRHSGDAMSQCKWRWRLVHWNISRTLSWWRFLYLKAIKGPIVFECQDVVRDGEDVAMCGDQTPEVDGFSCRHERRAHLIWHCLSLQLRFYCAHVWWQISQQAYLGPLRRGFSSATEQCPPLVLAEKDTG